jgi:hypothetical protein
MPRFSRPFRVLPMRQASSSAGLVVSFPSCRLPSVPRVWRRDQSSPSRPIPPSSDGGRQFPLQSYFPLVIVVKWLIVLPSRLLLVFLFFFSFSPLPSFPCSSLPDPNQQQPPPCSCSARQCSRSWSNPTEDPTRQHAAGRQHPAPRQGRGRAPRLSRPPRWACGRSWCYRSHRVPLVSDPKVEPQG